MLNWLTRMPSWLIRLLSWLTKMLSWYSRMSRLKKLKKMLAEVGIKA